MKSILFLTASVLVLAGCMTDKEYQLRAKDIEAKRAYPATYQPVVLTGPLELKEGASIVSTTPSQPYVPTDIPNGAFCKNPDDYFRKFAKTSLQTENNVL